MGATDFDTEKRDVYLNQAHTLLTMERYEEAKGMLLAALEQDPECGMAYQGLFLVSVRVPTFERLTADFLIPTEDGMSSYMLSEDPREMYGDIEKLYTKYEVEYFLTKKDIDLAVGIGSRSIESTYLEFVKREKERFIKIWEEDSNIQKAYEYCTLEEQFHLSKYYERLIGRFDASIHYYESQRRLQCLEAAASAEVKLEERRGRCAKLASELDGAVDRAEKEIASGRCREAYRTLSDYERHPKARRTMDKAVKKKQKAVDLLHTGAAILLTAMYLVVAGLFQGVELDNWILYPFFNIVLFAVGYAGMLLFEKLYVKNAIESFPSREPLKLRAFPKMIYTVLSAAATVYFLSTSSFTYSGMENDPELLATMLTVALPIFFMAVATLINAGEPAKLAVSAVILLATLVFTSFPFVLEFNELDVYGFVVAEEFYGHTVMPFLVAFIYGFAISLACSMDDKRIIILTSIAALAFEITATVLMIINEGYSGTFLFCSIAAIVAVIVAIKVCTISEDAPTAPRSSPSILYYRIIQSFDYKAAPGRASNTSYNTADNGGGYSSGGYSGGGGYYDDDDDEGSSSSSGYDYGSAFSSGSDDNDNNYDSADYNARSLGFNDADSAADSYGISRNDLYW